MKPRLKISSRYAIDIETFRTTHLIEFPKVINRKRVMDRAWTWFNGNGANRIHLFANALRESWKTEIDMIKDGGCIYMPYVMYQPVNP